MSTLVHSRLRATVLRAAILAVLGLFVIPGAALASCPAQPVSTPFAQWGDTNNYFPVPGGTFEGTADQVGWSLSGASLTPANESFFVNNSSDAQSLTIAGGGTATSPFFCVDNTMGSIRFFAEQAAAGGDLQVQALVQRSWGIKIVSLADLTDGSMPSWAPSQSIAGNTSSLVDGQTLSVALQFSVPASGASWQIDDLYVDPYRSG